MAYVPIFLEVGGRRCLIVGGGEVAARKATTLLEAGAEVTVVSPSLSHLMSDLARQNRIHYIDRTYEHGDMTDAALVYAATDDAELHRRLHAEARRRGILLNVADAPDLCTFIAPSVLTRGALKIAVSTEGASPAMAKRIRRRLERQFGTEYGLALEVLRAARHHLKNCESNINVRAKKLTALAASRIPEYLRRGDVDVIEKVLHRHIGVGLGTLGMTSIADRAATREDKTAPPVR